MGETIHQIEHDLAQERADLSRNLHELQSKARDLTDWRHHYRNHPGQLLGVALAAGLVLGIVAGGRSSDASSAEFALTPDNGDAYPRPPKPRNRAVVKLEEDWRHISDALMGVASAKLMDFVGNLVPGFREELRRTTGSIS